MSATQSRHPWRATVRTVAAFLLALAVVWPTLVELAGLNETWQWVSASVAVAGAITRVMADPRVIVFLERFLPFLAPEPKASGGDESGEPPYLFLRR